MISMILFHISVLPLTVFYSLECVPRMCVCVRVCARCVCVGVQFIGHLLYSSNTRICSSRDWIYNEAALY